MSTRQASYRGGIVLYSVAVLSLVSGLIHLWVTPEHFEEWWGYGTFFLVAAAAQVGYVPLLLRWPNRTILVLGIVGNSAIVLLYLLTRVVGIPNFGPEAGEVEGVGVIDVCATVSEAAIVVARHAAPSSFHETGRGSDHGVPGGRPAPGCPPPAPGAVSLVALGTLLTSANTFGGTKQRFGLLEDFLYVPL